ncbi:MAG: DUF1036 domain-containing protein [Pseudomonadota bacterium]
MRRPLAAIGVVGLGLGLLGTTPAQATPLDVCNLSSFVADVALGLETSTGAATKGWYQILPGQCREIMKEEVGATRHLLHIRPLALYGDQPLKEETDRRLCVRADDFVIAGATECAREGQVMADFVAIEPLMKSGRRQASIDETASYDREKAEVAGLQRLLMRAGFDVGTIDGLSGSRTAAAIESFSRETGFEASDYSGITIALTEKLANRGTADLPQFCNNSLTRVMMAIGEERDGGITSRGWFEIAPNRCVSPLTGRAAERSVYTFAEAVDQSGIGLLVAGKPVLWGGDTMLCTNNLEFEISRHGNCEARGLQSRPFRKWTPPGDAPLVVQFDVSGS